MGEDRARLDAASLDRVYDEYVRLGNACDGYVKSALSDIRLFGSIGILLTWDPLARLLELDSTLQQPVTPVGFIVLLLVIVMVMFYDLFKQSIFFFHLDRMRRLERVLNRGTDERVFHFAGAWPAWFRRTHAPIANAFFALFYLVIVGFPSTILYLQGYVPWMWLYLALAILLLAAHARIAMGVLHSLEEELEPD